jgi:hypothetical protein
MGRTAAAVQAVSQTDRPWQASQRCGGRHRPGVGCIRMGHRANHLTYDRPAITDTLPEPFHIQPFNGVKAVR